MNISEALKGRISTNSFVPDQRLDREMVESIISLASEAPSSFNIQHWRFVVVNDANRKAKLQKAAFGHPVGRSPRTVAGYRC